MKRRQRQFIENMELAVAKLVHGGYNEDAEALGRVVDEIHNKNYSLALKNAIAANLPQWYIDKMRRLFDLNRSSYGIEGSNN